MPLELVQDRSPSAYCCDLETHEFFQNRIGWYDQDTLLDTLDGKVNTLLPTKECALNFILQTGNPDCCKHEKYVLHLVFGRRREADSMNTYAKLTQILNDRTVTPNQDALFLYEFQKSALLALKENGTLSEIQFRHASEKLKEQYCRSPILASSILSRKTI